ncbi:Aminopeptidase YwaD [bacterium HR23]|nr:Aminopeptidase YwaD [bacterium HR23]
MHQRVAGRAVLLGVLLLALVGCQRATPTPVLTQPPPPSPTPTALPTPTLSPPLASFPLGEQVLEWVRQLVALSPRDTVSGGEAKGAQFLEDAFTRMGYQVSRQPFPITLVQSHVALLAPQEATVEGAHLLRSGEGEAEGEVVFIGLARPEDIPSGGIAGKIALADRGTVTFQEKARVAAEAGARALLVANNQPGLFQGAMQSTAPLPVVGISQEDGQRLKELLAQGTVRLRLRVWRQDYPSQNIIAEKPGPSEGVVLITAHYDTVEAVPGANDNSSGVGALLTLAQRLGERSWPFTLRFIAFGGEELGLWGSRAYVQSLSPEERQRIRAVLNLDVVGAAANLATTGDNPLAQRIVEVAREAGIPLGFIDLRDAASDHLPFLQAGVPAVILTTPDFRLIHTPQDRLEFLDRESLENTVRLVEAVLQRLSAETRQGRRPPVGARG